MRPINWCNRPAAYIQRTSTWDEFPNGRWGDSRSPAYGELSHAHLFPRHTVVGGRERFLSFWGESLLEEREVFEVFARYIEGKIPMLPWCEMALQEETSVISAQLAALNRSGFLTINSQPAVNAASSSHPVFGWGGAGGLVYQRAYVEFFASSRLLSALMRVMDRHPSLALHAVNADKHAVDSGVYSVTALTWGVFPNKEILQPTIFDPASFRVWSEEAFQLWEEVWIALYDSESASGRLLWDVSR